ncbi:MAG: hypothetical protein Q8K98_10220, partial [Bacteroidota bacterium]|nr:hypothetical protein [Bacteroidota bacterium]
MRYTKYNKIIHNFFYCLIALLIFISVPVSGVAKTFELNNYATNSMLPTASFYKDTVINDQFVIEANAGSNGTITPSGFVIVDQWNDQTFNFTPNTGYTVFDVLVNGVSVGRPASYTFISVTSNHTISVSFAIDTLTITASAGANGNIAPSGEVKVPYGSNQTFNITPNISYYISDVFVDSISVGSVPSYTFNNVTRNRTISSTFAQYNHNILATAGANGVITPSGLVYLNSGSNQSFNFTPNTGYHIFDVLVNGVSVGRPASYIFNNVSSNHTIAVSFAIDTLTITASAGANGNILPAGNVKVLYGSNQTFSFTPNTGYRIDSVFVNSVYVGAPSSYTFENIISNNTISAKFAILQYTITATAGLNGTITPSGIVQINHGASQNFRI